MKIILKIMTLNKFLISSLVLCFLLVNPQFYKKADAGSPSDSIYYFSDFVMGVKIEMKLAGSSPIELNKISQDAFDEMKSLDGKLSNWKEESEISRLNRAGAGRWIKVSPELFEVIAQGVGLSKKTGGAFDITVGKLLELWNFYGRHPVLPEKEKIEEALQYVDFRFISLDKDNMSVKFEKEGVKIDLGGIAKGYIMKKGYEVLRKRGVKAGLINCAGDIFVWGKKPSGALWAIAIRNPYNSERPYAVISVTDTAVFTSGDYEREFEKGGKRYHHIFDPRTGVSSGKCRGVTVTGGSIDDVNGLSSSLFVMGAEKGREFTKGLKGIEAVFFPTEGSAVLTDGFRQKYLDKK